MSYSRILTLAAVLGLLTAGSVRAQVVSQHARPGVQLQIQNAKDAVIEAVMQASYNAETARQTPDNLVVAMVFVPYAYELNVPRGEAVAKAADYLSKKEAYWKKVDQDIRAGLSQRNEYWRTQLEETERLKKKAELSGSVSDLTAAVQAIRDADRTRRQNLEYIEALSVTQYILADIEDDRKLVGGILQSGHDAEAAHKRLTEKANLLDAIASREGKIRFQ